MKKLIPKEVYMEYSEVAEMLAEQEGTSADLILIKALEEYKENH